MHGQHGVGQVGRFFEFKGEVGVRHERRNFLHAVQCLDPALCLLGLAGLGFEAGDEFLQMRDLVLLLGIGVLLQLHLLGAHVLKLAVVAAITHQLARIDVQRDVGHRVQKFAVMADHDHGAFITLQPGLQPHERVQVQVVGWLIE